MQRVDFTQPGDTPCWACSSVIMIAIWTFVSLNLIFTGSPDSRDDQKEVSWDCARTDVVFVDC